MTNKEIKFELAKVALEKCCFTTSETLTESLKNLYEWVVEEPEVEAEEHTQNKYDNISVSEILKLVRKNKGTSSGVTEYLSTAFRRNNIGTAGDLLKIEKQDFKKFRNIGRKSLLALDDALAELGATTW
jgi:DNA-directed RNA polymerase alpha subunit